MSLVISSTTDTQEQVNAAAGIEAPSAKETKQPPAEDTAPPTKPPAEPEPEPDEDEDEGEEEEQKPEQSPQQPKKKGGFQRRIESQQRQIGYLERQLQEVLAGTRKSAVEQPPQPLEPPRQEDFEDLGEFVKASTRHEVALARAEEQAKFRERQVQQQQQQVAQSWQQRVGAFRQTATDWDDVLAQVDHIGVPPALEQVLMQSELGPQLAYSLAQDPDRMARIVKAHPIVGEYLLGELEAEIRQKEKSKKQTPQISKAPEPITPVARGSNGNGPRTLDDAHDYQEFKRMREAQIAARRKAARKAA